MEIFRTDPPPQSPLWGDPDLREAYLAALAADAEALDDGGDEDDLLIPADCTPEEAEDLIDHFTDLEETVRAARALSAQQDNLFHLTLSRAAAQPDAWVGPDLTVDLTWRDPRGRSTAAVRADRIALAVRAAAADLGARVHLSDNQIRLRAYRADVLSTRMPLTWQSCLAGLVSEQNMAIAAQVAASLPDDATDAWAALDDALDDAATSLAPGRFRLRARVARERVHPESLTERHQRAAAARHVHVEADFDGMSYLTAMVAATSAQAIDRRLDAHATHLATLPGETRTHAQLRADAFVDLLTRDTTDSTSPTSTPTSATVHITIPALTLLGRSDEPAVLDGYGPIDIDTATRLAAGAPSWVRLLTHPFTGTVLDVERRAYRVPADLRRLLGVQHPTCIFPGCTRPARDCDIDHRVRWADGGSTSAENLAPECASHHPVKDETLWQLLRDPDTGGLHWLSPTGFRSDVDPPPF